MAEQIDSIALHEAAQARYLNYALSVITSRALPDVRDGFKPVQRRILYSMYHDLRLTKDSKHRKSAAVVGSVMAKYHPHGDQSIYDAMVRMAQSFSLRYPLVDGQGNFGSLDGDGAAAMRYTEARLESISGLMLEELKKKTVALRPNYDGQFFEPVVLPSKVPQLLLNGTTGIAVGMATNVPPHNLREVVKACVQLIDRPHLETDGLMKFIKGPDFPVGGRLLNSRDELLSIYEKGSGALKIVGEWEEEAGDRGQRFVVVTSIPYNVNKAQLVEKIADHIRSSKLPQLVDVRDESTDDIRIVLELAKGASASAAMAYLFKHTNLQTRFHVNLTCLVPQKDEATGEESLVPARISLKTLLRHFLDFRFEVVTKRLRFDLEQLEKRIHLLEAFAAIFGGLDEALALIRKSRDKKDAAEKLKKRFELDEIQVEAILETRLYKLARLEIKAIRQELREKKKAAKALRELLASDEKRWDIIKEELRAVARKHGDKRRTSLGESDETLEFNAEDYIVREDAVVIVTRDGWLKRQRSYSDISKLRVRENDEVGWVFRTMTNCTVILFTNRGQVYTLRADGIPATSGYGEPVQAHFDFSDGEKIVGVASTDVRCAPGAEDGHWDGTAEAPPPEYHMIAITRAGNTVRFGLGAYETPSTRAGRMYIKLKDKAPDGLDDGVVGVLASQGAENVCLATFKSRALIFPTSDVPLVKGRGRGVTAISLEGKDVVLAFCLSTHRLQGLEVETNRGRKETIRTTKFPVTKRGRKGRPIVLRGFLSRVEQAPMEIKAPDSLAPLARGSGVSGSKAAVKAAEARPKPKPEVPVKAVAAEVQSAPIEVDASVVAAAVSEVSTPPKAVYNNGPEPRAPDPDEEDEDDDQMTLF